MAGKDSFSMGQFSNDGAQDSASHVLPTLDRFRNKLLDLTTRNSLLNLGLRSQRSVRLLRFVDCNLQSVLDGLTNSQQYSLEGVLDLPIEIQSDLDSENQEICSGKNLSALAERQGINPSYVLSLEKEKEVHKGPLTALSLAPRFEHVAESIRKLARSSIEETGNNILYLAFGCLEWSEKNSSFFAPLILLPVELARTANQGGARTFYLGASDDAPVANVTLKERLKRDFGIELPLPVLDGDDVDLDAYLKAVADSVAERDGWGVHPYLNLALFNFSGLGLYEDLIPDSVQGSALVRQLLAAEDADGELSDEIAVIAEDIHVDQPEIAQRVPVLIAQADASQFAAVADVMAGRSMVIEGPPGTGKSQTITNMIANALYMGKRILFVAEKKVALDVVYSRLSDAGLKPYCLRIESDKANKRQVYEELAERIDLATPSRPKRDGVHEVFGELKDELNSFAALLNQPHGHEELSQHDLLWKDLQLRKELSSTSIDPSAYEMELKEACSNSKERIERNAQLLTELAQLLKDVDREQLELVFKPLGVLPADALGREQLLDQAEQWANALRTLTEALVPFSGREELSIEELRDAANQAVSVVSRLPDPLPAEAETLLPVLGAPGIAGMAQTLLDALQAESELEAVVAARFLQRPDPLPEAEPIQALVAALTQWRLGSLSVPAEQEGREALKQRLRQAGQFADRLEALLEASTTGLSLQDFSPASLEAMLPLAEHLGAQPEWLLRQRTEPIWTTEPKQARALVEEYNTLQQLWAQLNLDRAASQKPDPLNLDLAQEQLQRCCDRGLSAALAQPNAEQQWAQQIDQAQGLLESADQGLRLCLPQSLRDAAQLDQLLALAGLLRSVLALDVDALTLRMSLLWSADLKELRGQLNGEQELKRREQALAEAGLQVAPELSSSALKEAAELLEAKTLFTRLRNRLSGSKGRALELAQEIGASVPEQRPAALRDVAKVLELQESYGSGWQQRLFKVELPSERLLPVAEQLQSLEQRLTSATHGAFWSQWLRETSASDLQATLTTLEQDLQATLESLARHGVWSTPTAGCTLAALQERLNSSRQDQRLLAEAAPVARWASAAGLTDGVAMVDWLKQVQSTSLRQEAFPQQDLDALLSGGLAVEQVETVLDAAEHTRLLTVRSGLGPEANALLAADQASLSQALLTLQHQLAPLVSDLLEQSDALPADAKQRPLSCLVQDIQEAAKGYQSLLQQWLDAGFKPEASLSDLQQLPIDLALAHRRREEAIQALANFQQKVGPEVAGASSALLRQVMAWIGQLRQAGLPEQLVERCLAPGAAELIAQQRGQTKQLNLALKAEGQAAERFLETAQPAAAWIGDGTSNQMEALETALLQQWLDAIVNRRELYPIWVQRHQALEQLPADGTRDLADRLLVSPIEGAHWSQVYRWVLVRSQLKQMGEAIPELRQLRSREQVARRERFHRTEEELRALDRAEVIAAIHRDPDALPLGVSKGLRGEFTEMALISNECRKQRRHRPLRHLFQSAGESLRGLKPCWMMSPGSLASLVPREAIEQFDLVIVDEASQMPPERAFGLISRARQCVVVGDPKQLPPTSFFQRTASVDEEEFEVEVDTELLDEESILDLCTKTFNPVRRLKWHYRSRHGSLIAFSNKHFYNNELVVFPSCDRDFAIHRHLVTDARYAKGVNLPEVKVVCDVVLEQLELHPDRSLGVVAMNEAQASEIDEQLEMLSLHHEELRRRMELKDTSEELFVKSLEKVQGDERDTIVISYTYGPSEPGGPVAMRFGPVNMQGGHRRLNVLFSRAKRAIELVTSIESHQIQPTPSSSQGVHAFRNYLKFVESQSLETGRPSGREPDSPFEVVVAEAIQRHGYEVDCQVGVANYFIDLAIRHPDKPETYLLGVECDGATYHSARAARDRDKYRQSVLEGLGWEIYRIWSTDWFENAELETQQLIKHLEQLLSKR